MNSKVSKQSLAKVKVEFDYKEYARKMRLALSDKHITQPDGEINHQYFLVKKGQFWSQELQNVLLETMEKEAIGDWKKYQQGDLKNISEIELELRTCLTLGISDLQRYKDRTLTLQQINQERESNLNKAKETNKLKFGIYMI